MFVFLVQSCCLSYFHFIAVHVCCVRHPMFSDYLEHCRYALDSHGPFAYDTLCTQKHFNEWIAEEKKARCQRKSNQTHNVFTVLYFLFSPFLISTNHQWLDFCNQTISNHEDETQFDPTQSAGFGPQACFEQILQGLVGPGNGGLTPFLDSFGNKFIFRLVLWCQNVGNNLRTF